MRKETAAQKSRKGEGEEMKYKYMGEEAGQTYVEGPRGAGYTVNMNLAARNEKRPIYDKNEKLRGYICHEDIEQ